MWCTVLHSLLRLSVLPVILSQSPQDVLNTRTLELSAAAGRAPSPIASVAHPTWSYNRRLLKDWRLSDLAIVATLDGSLHALERTSGETRWTISSADTSIKASKDTTFNVSHDSLLDHNRDTWIVEPIDDGCLYTFNTKDGLFKLPFGIKQLVENSPFTIPGDDKVYVGERRTTLYSVDPRNGNVLQAYGTGFGYTSSSAPKCPVRDSLDELDDDNECVVADPNAKDILKIGRNTYMLTIFSGSETLWNVTYTEWVPNTIDTDLERQYAGTFDGTYISPMHDGKIIAHQTETNDAIWIRDLKEPTVRVFDVLQLSTPDMQRARYQPQVEAVAIVAQPLDPHFAESDHENYVDGDGSTYIGQTSGGDWFALSASKCPLVNGAPLSNWSSGKGRGSIDDLLGIHKHNRLADGQPASPGHLLTIDDTSTMEPKLIDDARRPRSYGIWLATLVLLIFGVIFGLKRITLEWSAKTLSLNFAKQPVPSVLQADGINVKPKPTEQEPVKANHVEMKQQEQNHEFMEKALPRVPTEDSFESETGIQNLPAPDTPKAKRKRGSRGGKKVRDAGKHTSDPVSAEAELEGDNATAADTAEPVTIIKKIPAEPLSGSESLFPLQINSLLVTDKILGYGSHGTIVYQGSFEGRDVAVKRMLLDFYDIASHEVVLLQESDDHPNVIRYYCKQENERFLYIALELCAASLADVTERTAEFSSLVAYMNDMVHVIQQMAQGIQYLHSLKIVHRDLKPQNILVNPPRKSVVASSKSPRARIVISDFGLCKKLDADQSSFRATTAQAAGTSGWRAPELLLDDSPDITKPARESSTSGSVGLIDATGAPLKVSRAIDIFSLGCVFYYVLSNGAHPFGDRYMREANIIRSKSNLDHLDILGDLGVLAKDLIGQMILHDPKDRPDATTVLQHPFFWSADRRLTFLLDISDRFEIEERDPPSPLLLMLESKSGEVIGGNWYNKLDKNLIENLGRYRKYNGASILDLLRALRNKKHHYQDLPENVQAALGALPGGFLNYFCSRFPLLLLHAYYLAKEELSHEAMFEPYYM